MIHAALNIHLWRRPDNKRYYAVWHHRNKTRKQSLKTKDPKTAKRRFNAFKSELIKRLSGKSPGQGPAAQHSVTLGDFGAEFLDHIKSKVAPQTFGIYRTAVGKMIQTAGAAFPLVRITSKVLDKIIDDMVADGLKPPTVNKYNRHIRRIIRKAAKWEYIEKAPEFPAFIKELKRHRFLTVEQMAALMKTIAGASPIFHDFCMLSAYTGLRSGEVLRLTVADIDHIEGYLRISPERKNKEEYFIPINTNARAILDRAATRVNVGRLWPWKSVHWISQKFKGLAIKAGFLDIRFHDLRHSFGTHMLAATGGDLRAVQKMMGHKSIASTMVYAGVTDDRLKRLSEKLNYGPMVVVDNKKNS